MTKNFYGPAKQTRNTRTTKRWTEQEIDAINKQGFFDGQGLGHHLTNEDKLPLPSSFTQDGMFCEAPLGKGLNPWESNYRVSIRKASKMVASKDNLPTTQQEVSGSEHDAL
jgi:hypothetical protein